MAAPNTLARFGKAFTASLTLTLAFLRNTLEQLEEERGWRRTRRSGS